MTEAPTKVPVEVKKAERPVSNPDRSGGRSKAAAGIDRLFDDFRVGMSVLAVRAVVVRRRSVLATEIELAQSAGADVAETEKADEVTAEVPGMDESNIEVELADTS